MSLIRDITNSGVKDTLHITDQLLVSGISTFDSITTKNINVSEVTELADLVVRNISVIGTTSGADGKIFAGARGEKGEPGEKGKDGDTVVNAVILEDPVFTGLTTIGSGINITQDDPGHIIYKTYASGSVYGLGQYNGGILRLFTSDNNGANVSIRFSKFTGNSGTYGGNSTTFDDMMIITNTGNVGINKANPTEKLDVNGNINCLALKINNTSILHNTSFTGIVTTGNVLQLGENSNDSVSKTLKFGGVFGDNSYEHAVIEHRIYSGTESSELLLFKGNDQNDRIRMKGGEIRFDTWSDDVNNRTSENTKMILTSAGNLGIGKTNPGDKLDVAGSINCSVLKLGGNSIMDIINNKDIGQSPTFTGNTVIIKGSSPTLKLVNNADRSAFLHNAGGFFYILNGNTNSETWTNNSTGEWPLKINLNTNYCRMGGVLSVKGTLECEGIFECAQTLKAYGVATFNENITAQKSITVSQKISSYGGCYIGGAESNRNLADAEHDWVTIGNQVFQPDAPGSINYGLFVQNAIRCLGVSVTSDERIKKDIADIDDIEALTILRALKPRTYKYKDFTKGDQTVIGYIAQEVKEILPQAVSVMDGEIPNIMMNANLVELEDGNMELTFENDLPALVQDDIIRVGQTIKCKVISATQRTVIIEYQESIKDRTFVAVYGQVIEDFHYLNKDVIFAMTTAACQQIDRELQLEKTKVATLENTILDMMERLSKLENP